jgi:hypothetical protein
LRHRLFWNRKSLRGQTLEFSAGRRTKSIRGASPTSGVAFGPVFGVGAIRRAARFRKTRCQNTFLKPGKIVSGVHSAQGLALTAFR